MEDKKVLNNEELNKVTGGESSTSRTIMRCCCGARIYDTNPTRINEKGIEEIQCTECGDWYRL